MIVYNSLDRALFQIASAFTEAGITWGVGGSRLLLAHKIVDSARDLDLLVSMRSAERALRLMRELGVGEASHARAPFCSRHFSQHRLSGVDVDLIAGYRIEHLQGVYEQMFDTDSISGTVSLGDLEIPLSSLEDWYVTYQLYPQKAQRAELIESHFQKSGLARPDLLYRALQGVLPDEVRVRIERLLVQLT